MPVARSIITLAMLSCLSASATAQLDPRGQPEAAGLVQERETVTTGEEMVVTAHPRATEAGARILAAGGSAVDAMIAAQLVLNLVEPQSSGIGGGAFLIHHDAMTGETRAYDGRETAPMAAGEGLFLDETGEPMPFREALVGGRAVGTPGLVRLLEAAHEAHGILPWERLFEPAIALAREGFPVSARLAGLLAGDETLARDPAARAVFHPEGRPLREGEILRNPVFAETLQTLAREGADAFYEGRIAMEIVAAVHEHPDNPGLLAEEDLAGYAVQIREPVCFPFRAYEICGMGPPSSGALAVGQILGLMEHFDLAGLDPAGADMAHLFAEASKLAFADRALYVADADHVSVPVVGMLDRSYLTARAQLIDRDRAGEDVAPGNPPWRDARMQAPDPGMTSRGTTHLSIVDAAGNVISMTSTIESGFGARIMAAGFLLNNQLTDFSFRPAVDGRPVANRVAPGKRPRSSMAPTIVFDERGAPVYVTGSPGGARIIHYVARNLIAHLAQGLSPQEAVELPHIGGFGAMLDLERETALEALLPLLEARGHTVRLLDMTSGVHAIAITDEGFVAGVDPRREGAAGGR